MTDLFPGFEAHWINTEGGRIFARSAGSGPPVLLLHGFPQTQACWHKIAPALARTRRVVLMDLRGYGWSSAPRGDARHETYSKRAMGEDVVAAMERLGHARFDLVGHDRGARVGYRLALDHPGRLSRLALLDILPTAHVWERIQAGAIPGAHWAFLSRPYPEPEEAIAPDPTGYLDGLLAGWTRSGTLDAFDRRALRLYHESGNDPTRIHAYCEDYRAGATRDLEADHADLAAGRIIAPPVLVAWGDFYLTGQGAETPLDVWRRTFAPRAEGVAIPDAGHFVMEENPEAVIAALDGFLTA